MQIVAGGQQIKFLEISGKFLKNILSLRLVESEDVEPMDRKGRLYLLPRVVGRSGCSMKVKHFKQSLAYSKQQILSNIIIDIKQLDEENC